MMSTRGDGGTAFPVSIPGCGDNGQEGMSLRDYFAAQALVGLIGISQAPPSEFAKEPNRVAQIAFMVADAMLSARN